MISGYYFAGHQAPAASRNTEQERGWGYLSGWIIVIFLSAVYLARLYYRLVAEPAWISVLPSILSEMFRLIEWGITFTLIVLWTGLLWRQYHPSTQPSSQPLNLEQLHNLSPEDFERYVAKLFSLKNYRVVIRGGSGDHGVDIELASEGYKRAIVQCKRYTGTVGEEVVRDLYGTLLHEHVSRAFLITTGEISAAAYVWAQGKPITLIDGSTLVSISSS